MIYFRDRDTRPELMDDPECDPAMLVRTLKQFEPINRWLSASRKLIGRYLLSDMRRRSMRWISVLDLGAGGGDIADWLDIKARRDGMRLRIVCLDPEPTAAEYMRRRFRNRERIEVVQSRLGAGGFAEPVDYLYSNHMMHHLANDELSDLFHRISEITRFRALLNDLVRSRLSHAAFSVLSLGLRDSFARADGLHSIRKGWMPHELRAAVGGAQWPRFRVGRAFPGRVYLLGDFRRLGERQEGIRRGMRVIGPFQPQGMAASSRRQYARVLFEEVAPVYQTATRGLSLGRDRQWKQWLLKALPEMENPTCLDLACGTGDLASALSLRYPRGKVYGLDLVPAMLRRAAKGAYVAADMGNLPFPDASVDIVTGSYALRNAPDLESVFAELHRVMRPGGHGHFLEFTRAEKAWEHRVRQLLLRSWGGLWGLALHGNPEVYAYIARSLESYPGPIGLAAMLSSRGFGKPTFRPLMGGFLHLCAFRRL